MLILVTWARADIINNSAEDQNGPSAENAGSREHATDNGNIINIDTMEQLYSMMGKDLPDGAATEIHSRRAKGNKGSSASATEVSSLPGGHSVEEEQMSGDGNEDARFYVIEEDTVTVDGLPAAATGIMEDASEVEVTMGEIPSITAGDLPQSEEIDDAPIDPVYIESLPTYTDVEDVDSYDVDENEIPSVYSAGQEHVAAEDIDERGSIPLSDNLGPLEGDGDNLSVEEMFSQPGSLDVDEELSKMNIKKGDLLSSMNTDKVRRHCYCGTAKEPLWFIN